MTRSLIVVDPNYQNGFSGFLKSAIKNGDIVVVSGKKLDGAVYARNFSNAFRRIFGRSALWTPNIFVIYRLIKKYKIAHVHVIGEPTYFSVGFVCLLKIFKFRDMLITCRTAQNCEFSIPFPFNLNLWLGRKAKVVSFPVSSISANYCKSHYRIPIAPILPNGVPSEFYETPRNDNDDNSYVLFVGHFIERKGFFDFLEVAKKNPSVSFVAIGALPTGTELEASKMPSNLTTYAWMARERLVSMIDRSDVVLVPSKISDGRDVPLIKRLVSIPWMEQFGRIIVESYARGRRVIAYDSGAISDLIIDASDLIPEGDTCKMSDRLLEVLSINSPYYLDGVDFSKKFKWEHVYSEFKDGVNLLNK
jgi:glycosyltransferase involved in cell wall biosynthesis